MVDILKQYPLFCTVKQTARATGLSERMIRKYVNDGTAPHLRAGVKILVDLPAFLEILHTQSRGKINAES